MRASISLGSIPFGASAVLVVNSAPNMIAVSGEGERTKMRKRWQKNYDRGAAKGEETTP